MGQSISDNFQAALIYLLEEQGRGAQSRLARQQQIDRGYLNAVIKGRKPGSEEIRGKIAGHFQLTYEDMLALGRSLLEPTISLYSKDEALIEPAKQERTSPLKKQVEDQIALPVEKPRIEIATRYLEQTKRVSEILSSQNVYGEIMERLIDIIYEASKQNTENQALKKRVADLESRLSSLEKRYPAS